MQISSVSFLIGNTRITAEVADTLLSRTHGLSDRESLAPDAGMLFVFSESTERNFWMSRMHFPLDIIWIDTGVVVGYEENIAPTDESGAVTRFSSGVRADAALEVNAGFIRQNQVKIGDRAVILTE